MIPKTEAITLVLQDFRAKRQTSGNFPEYINNQYSQQAEDSTMCCSPYSTSILELAHTRMKT